MRPSPVNCLAAARIYIAASFQADQRTLHHQAAPGWAVLNHSPSNHSRSTARTGVEALLRPRQQRLVVVVHQQAVLVACGGRHMGEACLRSQRLGGGQTS